MAGSALAQVPQAASDYQRLYTRTVSAEWGLAPPVASFAAQIHQESGWNCRAVSRVGARGCAQFMPATARWIEDVSPALAGFGAGLAFDPYTSFRAQAVYMRWLHDRVKGPEPCERMAFAMSAYNGGLGYVYRRQKEARERGLDPLRCLGVACEINPGITPANQRENAHYPRRILLELEPRYAAWGLRSCKGWG